MPLVNICKIKFIKNIISLLFFCPSKAKQIRVKRVTVTVTVTVTVFGY